tara:strand:- start:116 stop:811 length:696 start_codon:yes stop_codon:yes gene_type:complete
MKLIINKRNFLFLLFSSIFLSFFIFDLDSFFTLEYFRNQNLVIQKYVDENFFISLIFFYSLFLILIFFFLPVSAIMVVTGSFLFTPYITIPVTVLTITLGGVLNFFLLKNIRFASIFDKANLWIKKLKYKIKDNEIQYLLLLRLVPIPFIVQNAINVILNISLKRFFFTTLFGVTPYIIIYSLAGFKLKKIINSNELITMEYLLTYENFFIIFLLFFLIILSIFFKRKLKI